MNIHSLTTTDKSMSNFIKISFDMLSLKNRTEELFDFYVTLLRLRFDPFVFYYVVMYFPALVFFKRKRMRRPQYPVYIR